MVYARHVADPELVGGVSVRDRLKLVRLWRTCPAGLPTSSRPASLRLGSLSAKLWPEPVPDLIKRTETAYKAKSLEESVG